jgi:hypothetical protein
MSVTMKNAVSWDVAPCRSCVNRRFGGTYRLHLQSGKICERGTSVRRRLNFVYYLEAIINNIYKNITNAHKQQASNILKIIAS